MRFPFVPCAVLMAATCAMPVTADAAYDMSGKWLLVPAHSIVSRLDLVQTGGTLSQPIESGYGWTGTIDEGTGEFHLTAVFTFSLPCTGWTIDGFVAADGKTFTADVSIEDFVEEPGGYHCEPYAAATTGSRCGNNELDDGENCDFGDAADGDCCSSSCVLADAGTSCVSDGTECTNDICNASGTCEHLAVPGSCVEPHGCGSGECSGGSCMVTAPVAAGTACDLDDSVCTPDSCDGAGVCAAGEPITCGPCDVCEASYGCIAGECDFYEGCTYGPPDYCSEDLDAVTLSIRASERPESNRIRLVMEGALLSNSVGNPATDTRYTVCVYADDGPVVRTVFSAVISPAGLCDGENCWQELNPGSFRYKDKTLANGGISRMDVHQWAGFKLKGKKENLSLVASLPVEPTMIPTIKAWEAAEYYNRRCWSHPVTASRPSAGRFRGKYEAVAP